MTRGRLGFLLVIFFLALAVPTSILVYQAYGQLKWEAFHQHQQLARELTLRIDAGFRDLIRREEGRPISEYEFYNVTGSGEQGFLQRSPLSAFPPDIDVPGLLGYFQVDGEGQLRTPLVPEDETGNFSISENELEQRRVQEGFIRGILDRNRLVSKSQLVATPFVEKQEVLKQEAPGETVPEETDTARIEIFESLPHRVLEIAPEDSAMDDDGPAQSTIGFDELSRRKLTAPSGAGNQVEDLELEDSYDVAAADAEQARLLRELQAKELAASRQARKEKVTLPQSVVADAPSPIAESLDFGDEVIRSEQFMSRQAIRIQTFESEVEPMEFALLDSGHFVLFRRVWRDRQRYVQGLLIDRERFIDAMVAPAFSQSSLSSMSRLIVAYQGGILRNFDAEYSRLYRPSATQVNRELLYQSRLIAPFGDVELIYTLARLPIGAGGEVILWSALVLAIVLIGGCAMLYRLGLRQLALARQQQDFVSAVSHELKTPLTSIRMYGEMLREGWADEGKRRSYYDFIYHEAERLTRLINNVLQLARLSRSEQQANLAVVSVDEALSELRPRLASQLEAAAFELAVDCEDGVGDRRIRIDLDWFLQIFINLVDNAIKFSANGDRKRIDIACRALRSGQVQFSVRDYGPGIAPDQMKKIFTLFYRSENELTRETVGTGIGLALVRQLAVAMQAEIDVLNRDPGAEFHLRFQAQTGA